MNYTPAANLDETADLKSASNYSFHQLVTYSPALSFEDSDLNLATSRIIPVTVYYSSCLKFEDNLKLATIRLIIVRVTYSPAFNDPHIITGPGVAIGIYTPSLNLNSGKPINFVCLPFYGDFPLAVEFRNLSPYPQVEFVNGVSYWDFGDGFTSGVEEASHIYAEPGIYHIKLFVRVFGVDTFGVHVPGVVVLKKESVPPFKVLFTKGTIFSKVHSLK